MKWAARLSLERSLADALEEAGSRLEADLGGQSPDLVFAFLSKEHRDTFGGVPDMLRERFGDAVVIGCSGGGVVASGREIEDRAALSLTAAVLPDVALVPFHLEQDHIDELGEDISAWHDHLELVPEQQPIFLLLADPFTSDAAALGHYLDRAFPHSVKLGGLSSGGSQPGELTLFLEDGHFSEGVVGVAMYGDIEVEPVVAQGCRPVGERLTITRSERNLIYELDGEPAVEVLERVLRGMPDADRQRFRRGPMIGLVVDPSRSSARSGDYLVRNFIGLDRSRGLIGVGALVDEGQPLRFHVRDAETSSEDLKAQLGHVRDRLPEPPAGALLFSCLGRGEGLYGVPDHDVGELRRQFEGLPVGGFFCNGEIGPVHGRTFLHGYTSAIGLFRSRPWS